MALTGGLLRLSLRDRAAVREWLAGLSAVVATAVAMGHLEVDPDRLTWTLHGIELSMNLRLQLLGDLEAVAQARQAMADAVLAVATPLGLQQR